MIRRLGLEPRSSAWKANMRTITPPTTNGQGIISKFKPEVCLAERALAIVCVRSLQNSSVRYTKGITRVIGQ